MTAISASPLFSLREGPLLIQSVSAKKHVSGTSTMKFAALEVTLVSPVHFLSDALSPDLMAKHKESCATENQHVGNIE